MKHIFIVHSNITYLIALGVIHNEGINLKDVLIISDSFICDGPIPISIVKVEASRNVFKESIKRYVSVFFNPRSELYRLIDGFLNGDKFIAYVPVLHLIKKLVILHPNCEQFHFIEEGTASYSATISLEEYGITHLNQGWFYPKGVRGLGQRFHTAYREFGFRSAMIESIPIFYMNHDKPDRNFYGLSNEAYPALKWGRKIIVALSSILETYKWNGNILELSNACVWIGDPDVSSRYGSESFKKCIIDKLIPSIRESTLYVRFHYRESEEQRLYFIDLLDKHSVKYNIIDDKQIMELVFLKSKNCKCYSFCSSLLLYSRMLGQQSYSIASGISALQEHLDSIMPCFTKFVKYI